MDDRNTDVFDSFIEAVKDDVPTRIKYVRDFLGPTLGVLLDIGTQYGLLASRGALYVAARSSFACLA